jgi:hypothetical protein
VKIFVVRGGLGNQLYIYAEACRYDSVKLVFFPKQLHSERRQDNLNGLFDLDNIIGWFPGSDSNWKRIANNLFLTIILKFSNIIGRVDWLIFRTGYYQNTGDVSSIGKIVQFLRFNGIKINPYSESGFLGMHIRRGDYLLPRNSGVFVTRDLRWYFDEARHIFRLNAVSNIYVFTDDPAWLKSHIRQISGFKEISDLVVVVDSDVVEVFIMMLQCKYFIGSSSTLSYWAVMIGKALGVMETFVLPDLYYQPGLELDSPYLYVQ